MLIKLYKKDMAVLLSDKKGLFIFILMPIVLTTILSFALSGNFGEPGVMSPIEVAIVKSYDKEAESNAYLDMVSPYMGEGLAGLKASLNTDLNFESLFFDTFLGNNEVKAMLSTKVMSEEEARKALEEKSVKAIVILPKGFIIDQLINYTMPNRNEMKISIIRHPDYSYSGDIVESIVTSYFETLNKQIVNKNTYLSVGSAYLDQATLMAKMSEIMSGDAVSNSEKVKRSIVPGKRLIDSPTYYSIAMMGMFILYSAGYMGRELLREKRLLTLDRASVAGVSYFKVLAGKFLMTITLCVIQMSILILFAKFALGVDWLNPLKILVGIFFSAVAVSGVGVFVSALTLTSENYRVANIFENLLIHLFALIGGSYIPLDVLPKIFMTLKYFALNGIVIDLFLNTYQDAGWRKLGIYYLSLVCISIFFSILTMLMIKRKEVFTYEGTH